MYRLLKRPPARVTFVAASMLVALAATAASAQAKVIARGTTRGLPWRLSVYDEYVPSGEQGIPGSPGLCLRFEWAWGPRQKLSDHGENPFCDTADTYVNGRPVFDLWGFNGDGLAANVAGEITPSGPGITGSSSIRAFEILTVPAARRLVVTDSHGKTYRVSTHAIPASLHRSARVGWIVIGTYGSMTIRSINAYNSHGVLVAHSG